MQNIVPLITFLCCLSQKFGEYCSFLYFCGVKLKLYKLK